MIRFKLGLATASALAIALSASPAFAQNQQDDSEIVVTGHPELGEYGLDLTGLDTTANPGSDFERYANGKWLDRTEIPSDRASMSSFDVLAIRTEGQMKDIVSAAAPGSKTAALYRSFTDEKAVERAGLAPLMADIAKVRGISDKAEMARYMGHTNGAFGTSIFNQYVDVDPDAPTRTVLNLVQSGLGLPERDYYLNPRFAPQRQAYSDYMVRTFRAIGTPNPEEAAAKVMEFETYVAQLSWPAADRRNIDLTNNPYSSAQLAAYAPEFDWSAYFDGLGLPAQDKMIVNENTAIQRLAKLYAATPLDTLKLWQAFHVAEQASPYLTKKMVDSRFEFTSKLSGVAQQRERWKRGITLLNGSIGEQVGQEYVEKFFPPIAKAKMEELVANLKLAMADRIRGNSWMSPETKQAALAKLENTLVMVGYPDKWRNYDALTLKPDDLYGNVSQATAFNTAYAMSKLAGPVDRKEWHMVPQTVNAYNGGQLNEIVFPAAILQPPFFDPAADDAINYGGIGVVIGHEISHSFDDQGRKIDAEGRIRDWWTQADAERFDAEAEKYGAQFAKYEAVPGAFVNPDLTMGENIADLAGLHIALDAYHRSLNGKEAPVIGGLSGDQRFFLGFAQVWRDKTREDALRSQITADPHSPARFRIIGPLRNIDAWYDAFGVKPGDSMYIPPEKRVHIW